MLAMALLVGLSLAVVSPVGAQDCDDCDEIKAHLRAQPASQAAPTVTTPTGTTVIYIFWGDGCPHCEVARPFLARLAEQHPGVELREFEVWYDQGNQELFMALASKMGFQPSGVPTIVIGERYWIGFSEQLAGQEIAAYLDSCAPAGCGDAGQDIPGLVGAGQSAVREPTDVPAESGALSGSAVPATEAPLQSESEAARAIEAEQPPAPGLSSEKSRNLLLLPVVGAVDLGNQSLAVATALIAFVDGFNPCSLWVLSLLLSLTLHTGSRRRVLIIGLVFLTVTSLVYALFIAGLFTMFTVVSFVGWIQAVVALVALFFALVNIKDYFWYKEGISFTISDESKPGLYRNMRRVLSAGDSLPALIGATVILSAGASLVEFSCTAGFPVLWTNLLISQQATAVAFIALLLLYMVIYQIDELGIFLLAVAGLRASRLEEKHGRVLKLIGGMLMLTLAAVMLLSPALMSEVSTTLLLFGVAMAATLLVLLVHRAVLPRFGIHLGTELGGRARRKSMRAPRVTGASSD